MPQMVHSQKLEFLNVTRVIICGSMFPIRPWICVPRTEGWSMRALSPGDLTTTESFLVSSQ